MLFVLKDFKQGGRKAAFDLKNDLKNDLVKKNTIVSIGTANVQKVARV